jgi:hypothetical protein
MHEQSTRALDDHRPERATMNEDGLYALYTALLDQMNAGWLRTATAEEAWNVQMRAIRATHGSSPRKDPQ